MSLAKEKTQAFGKTCGQVILNDGVELCSVAAISHDANVVNGVDFSQTRNDARHGGTGFIDSIGRTTDFNPLDERDGELQGFGIIAKNLPNLSSLVEQG